MIVPAAQSRFDSTASFSDVIVDFAGNGKLAGDRIDLSTIDADVLAGGDQAFTFIGTDDFTALGQIRIGMSGGFAMHAIVTGEGMAGSLALILSVMFGLNAVLFFFNLIPIPPLDGGSAIGLLLPPVDVADLEIGDFARAQPHVQGATNDGVAALRPAALCSERVQQALDLVRLERARQ